MKPRNAAIIGGLAGLVLGVLFLSDVSGGPIFSTLVVGFFCSEAAWALNTIGETKGISKSIKSKHKPEKQEDDSAS